jgi:hypothetical protein
VKKQFDSYHTARQPHSETDIGPQGNFGDGHEHCREVEATLCAQLEAALAELAETTARRDESRGLVLEALRGGR